jgi:hypothetical protein
MVFQLRNANMPQVKVLAEVLKHFRLDSDLWLLEGDNLFQECLAEL